MMLRQPPQGKVPSPADSRQMSAVCMYRRHLLTAFLLSLFTYIPVKEGPS